jgi:hypothetical protein
MSYAKLFETRCMSVWNGYMVMVMVMSLGRHIGRGVFWAWLSQAFLSHALFFDILVLSTGLVVFSWDFVIAEAKWEYLCRLYMPIEI